MRLTGPILAACDLGPASDEVLRQADALARGLGTELLAAHVLPELHHARVLFPQLHGRDAADVQAIEQRAAEAVSSRVEAVTGRSRGEFQILLDSGSPHGGLLRQAEYSRAGVLVVAPGAAAPQVVRHAYCPVLVARPSPTGCVLGATDFSDPALPALATAASEADRRAVPLAVVHCIDLTPHTAASEFHATLPYPSPQELAAMRDAVRKDLETGLRQLRARGKALVEEGPAARAIAATAAALPAELLVVGTRGRTGLARLALGSVAETLLEIAPCSVLVVRLGSA